MMRKTTDEGSLFLCQSSDWQCVVEADTEDDAATIAVEGFMQDEGTDYPLATLIGVQRITRDIFQQTPQSECRFYYSPMILANAGYYAESKQLDANIHAMFEKAELLKKNE